MSLSVLTDANEIYVRCNSHNLEIIKASHETARNFSVGLRSLERKLADLQSDQYWSELLKPLRRYRFQLSALPLAFNSKAVVPAELREGVLNAVSKCKFIFPEFSEAVEHVAYNAKELMGSPDSPLLNALVSAVNREKETTRIAVLLRGAGESEVQQELRRSFGKYEIETVTTAALTRGRYFDVLIAIGAMSWFPEFLRSSPRARKLISIRFDWVTDNTSILPAFLTTDPKKAFPRVTGAFSVQIDTELTGEQVTTLEPADILPPTNWADLTRQISRQTTTFDEAEEVQSRLILLHGGVAVFVEASQTASVQIIDFDGPERIARVPAADLEVGMHVLLRTGGGGDLVAIIADNILGNRASEVKSLQRIWKDALRDVVKQCGEVAAVKELADLGCKRASRFNLRRWMSDRNIRPEIDDDFLSILVLCRIDNEEGKFVANAKLLDRVHRRAGFVIRNMLLKTISKANLDELLANGLMEFQLEVSGGGSFTAYKIEDISPDTFNTPLSQIGHIFDVN